METDSLTSDTPILLFSLFFDAVPSPPTIFLLLHLHPFFLSLFLSFSYYCNLTIWFEHLSTWDSQRSVSSYYPFPLHSLTHSYHTIPHTPYHTILIHSRSSALPHFNSFPISIFSLSHALSLLSIYVLSIYPLISKQVTYPKNNEIQIHALSLK